jgi:hypothetical protein
MVSDENIFEGRSDLLLSALVANLPRWIRQIQAELSDMPVPMELGTMSRRDITENNIVLIWRDELHDEEHLLVDLKQADDGSSSWRACAQSAVGRIYWTRINKRYLQASKEFRATALGDVNMHMARVLSRFSQRMGDRLVRKGQPEYDFPVPDISDAGYYGLRINWGADLCINISPETGIATVKLSSKRGERLWQVFIDAGYFSGGPYKKTDKETLPQEKQAPEPAAAERVFDGRLTLRKRQSVGLEFDEVMFKAFDENKKKDNLAQGAFAAKGLDFIYSSYCKGIENAKEIIDAQIHMSIFEKEKDYKNITLGDIVGLDGDAFWKRYRTYKNKLKTN